MTETSAYQQVLGKYGLMRELGRGGMGIVYEAVDTTLTRRVALKLLVPNPGADPKSAQLEEERFLRETRLSASLPKHPHVVGVYEAGVIEGRRYLAMEFIEGVPLSDWAQGEAVTLRRQVEVLRDVARAVYHAHQHGVVHRDLKPENVLMDVRGNPHVTDFGLAKAIGPNVNVSLTAPGMAVGTPAYMAPEQAQALKTADHRADVYSLGIMLYEALAGRRPFDGESPLEIMMKAVKQDPPSPSTIMKAGMNPELQKSLENVCLKAMAKNPRDRYPTAGALADDLTAWLEGREVHVPPPPRTRRLQAARRARRWIPIAVSAAVVLGVGVLLFFFTGFAQARREAERLRRELSQKAQEPRAAAWAPERNAAAPAPLAFPPEPEAVTADTPSLPLTAFRPMGKVYMAYGDWLHVGSNGTVEATVRILEPGEYEILVSASGEPAKGEYPRFKLHVDGNAVGEWTADSDTPKDFAIRRELPGGTVRIGIEFTNDLYIPAERVDRNLHIHSVILRRPK